MPLLAQAEDGDVLLDGCRVVAADLLVMGAAGRSRISEFVLGGGTSTVLRDAALPALQSG